MRFALPRALTRVTHIHEGLLFVANRHPAYGTARREAIGTICVCSWVIHRSRQFKGAASHSPRRIRQAAGWYSLTLSYDVTGQP